MMTLVDWLLVAALLTFVLLFLIPMMFFLCARMTVLGAYRGRMCVRREFRNREGDGYES